MRKIGGFISPQWYSKMLIDLIYPIGSIYMSINDINPFETLDIGTWERIQDTFLLASGTKHTLGSTGGEESHTLIIDEIPKHSHKMKYDSVGWTAIKQSTGTDGIIENTSSSYDGQYSTDEIGGDKAHNNMPPYLVVNMWKRTA